LAYHDFADQRALGFIPNFWNVVSNAGFFVVGVYGLWLLLLRCRLQVVPSLRLSYTLFLAGVTLVAFGSGYYHWRPNNQTLLWDRLPMTLAFMALLSVTLGEFLAITWARRSLWPLLLIGVMSVLFWFCGELRGAGDLRPYALVQFLPMILMLVLFVLGRSKFEPISGYWWLFGAYVLAKVFEHFDGQILALTHGVMAGHAMKHVCAALGLWALLLCYKKRVRSDVTDVYDFFD
jgi:predicted membrane channel-forming protein YqfA (hemolysin III family)